MNINSLEQNLENPTILYFEGEDTNSYLRAKTLDNRHFIFNPNTQVWDEITDNKERLAISEKIIWSGKYSEVAPEKIEESPNTYLLDI